MAKLYKITMLYAVAISFRPRLPARMALLHLDMVRRLRAG